MKQQLEEQQKLNEFIYQRINQILMSEERPSSRLTELSETEEFSKSDFGYLNEMKKTEQSKQHHPEGNVWNHTMLVVDEAWGGRHQSKDPRCFMWAAFLHDIGKPEVTRVRKGKITAYDHDKVGAVKCRKLLEKLNLEEDFIYNVTALVRWHMQILFVAKGLSFADVDSMKKEVDMDEVALLGMCDRMGRLGVDKEVVMRDIEKFKAAKGN